MTALDRARRAEEHYRDAGPWRLLHEHDMRNARYRVRATVVQPLPADLRDAITAVFRDLRSSLDAAVTRLADRPTRFPIHESLAEFAQRARKALRPMPDVAQAAIEELQPYHAIGGFANGPLWILGQLHDADVLRLAAGAVGPAATFGINTARKVEVVGEPAIHVGAFDDGAVVADATTRIVGPDPKLDMYFTADLRTAFARNGPARGREVIPLLQTLCTHVTETVLPRLEP